MNIDLNDRVKARIPALARISLTEEAGREILKSIDGGHFYFDYQPQLIRNEGGVNVSGAEMLVRWNHPLHGLLQPDRFIRYAEDSGAIVAIGNLALRVGCVQLRFWANEPTTKNLEIHVNVSHAQIDYPDFVQDLKKILDETGANPRLLKLELTESIEIKNIESLLKKMSQLIEIGVTFSLDDFGIGFSSLSVLSQLPVDSVKLDQSFVNRLSNSDMKTMSIVATIYELCRGLGVKVLAEGVETNEQFETLDSLGFDRFQGFYFARPMTLEVFEEFNKTQGFNFATVSISKIFER